MNNTDSNLFSKLQRPFAKQLSRKYPHADSEKMSQIHIVFMVLACMWVGLGTVVVTTDSSVANLAIIGSMFALNSLFLVLIFMGRFAIVNALFAGGFWLGLTLLAYNTHRFRIFEIYQLTTFYLFLLFISALVIRSKFQTILLSVLSVASVWLDFGLRWHHTARFPGGDVDDYVAASGVLLVATLIARYLHLQNARLLWDARQEAVSKSEQAADLIALNVKLKAGERELKALRDYLASIIDSMPSVLIAVDANGDVVQWNREAEKRSGVLKDDAIGKPLSVTQPAYEKQMQMAIRACGENTVLAEAPEYRSHLFGAETASTYFATTVYPVRTADLAGAVIRLDDVTEQIRMQEMIVQTEKMLSVGGLAAGMAHEINNPLGGILQNIAVIRNRLTQNLPRNLAVANELGLDLNLVAAYLEQRQVFRMIDLVTESGKRAAEIVYNMLSFSRKDTGGLLPVQLGEIVQQSLQIAATEFDLQKQFDFKKIKVTVESEECPMVRCEPPKIQQVILNILRNGAEAMQEAKAKGLIDREPEFWVRLSTNADKSWVTIEITDNGPGMEEAVRKRVFEPFFTTREVGQGTGLGLSVSYFIVVENHGGQMDVQSVAGEGATFYVRLPVQQDSFPGMAAASTGT